MRFTVQPRRIPLLNRIVAAIRIAMTLPIWIYQRLISPALPSNCIYHPSCSEYARQSIIKHGLLGILLAVFRILRCTGALFQGGEDPVPGHFSFRYLFGSYREFWQHRH